MQRDEDMLIAQQQREIAVLRERVRQLEDVLTPPSVIVPIEWLLTPHESALFRFLATRDRASKLEIMSALYGARPEADEPEVKIVDVFVCKARKKLAPFGVVIEKLWGHGYALRDRTAYLPPRAEQRAAA